VNLSDKGFDPAKIEKWPVQALVISTETATSLTLQNTKTAPGKAVDKKRIPRAAKKPTRA
jgi:hypothetical protein